MEPIHRCYQPGPHKKYTHLPMSLPEKADQARKEHPQPNRWVSRDSLVLQKRGTSHGVTLSENFLLATAKHEILPYCPSPAIDNYKPFFESWRLTFNQFLVILGQISVAKELVDSHCVLISSSLQGNCFHHLEARSTQVSWHIWVLVGWCGMLLYTK